MRKYFLLVVYITGLVFTRQGLSAKLPSEAFKMSVSAVIAQKINTSYYVSKNDCYNNVSYTYRSDFNFEEDENAKPKSVNAASPSWLQTDLRSIVETNQLKYKFSFNPVFPFDLFKLNRVFRL